MDLLSLNGPPPVFSIGINHRTAPVDVREKIAVSPQEIPGLLNKFKDVLEECLVLSTCNRTELYGVTLEGEPDYEHYKKIITDYKGSDKIKNEYFYQMEASEAIEHLFRVASSIDSMVIGDLQILHQVKEAYTIAQQNHSSGKIINQICQKALHAGKRTKTETTLFEGAFSVSFAAVELALKIFEDLKDKSILVIGAGETAELTAENLLKKKVKKLFVTNRTKERADEMLGRLKNILRFDGEVIPFESFTDKLSDIDIIISSTGSNDFVVNYDDFKNIYKKRSDNPMLVIDIAVPRDVDPKVKKFSNVFLKNIDDLKSIVDSNLEKRQEIIPIVENIINQEIEHFHSWYNNLQLVPTIKDIEDKFEKIRLNELAKNSNGFNEHDKKELEKITRNIVHNILRSTIPNFNEVYLEDGHTTSYEKRGTKLELIRKIFGLEKRNPKETNIEKR
jgi:glutamyl-tRNA reductase